MLLCYIKWNLEYVYFTLLVPGIKTAVRMLGTINNGWGLN